MQKVPVYKFVCECCGREFNSEFECRDHERATREREERRRNCPHCYGTGYVTESSGGDYIGTSFGRSFYTPTRVHKVPCPHCSR